MGKIFAARGMDIFDFLLFYVHELAALTTAIVPVLSLKPVLNMEIG